MQQLDHVALALPLLVGILTIGATIAIHAIPLSATINTVRREKRLGHVGRGFWFDIGIVAVALFYALLAHLAEMALWAAVYLACGEFHNFGLAFYHSAVNYTSLGYGDLLMTPSWRLLGPLETANGMLMFGVSTAMIFAVIQRLVEIRFVDLKD
jgi:Ion channel